MKTYYIVKTVGYDGKIQFNAHERGILSTLNIFNSSNLVICTWASFADGCEERLRIKLAAQKVKPIIVRVVKL